MSKGSRYVLSGKTVKTTEQPVAGFSMTTTSDAADYQNPAFDVTKSVEMIPLGTLKQHNNTHPDGAQSTASHAAASPRSSPPPEYDNISEKPVKKVTSSDTLLNIDSKAHSRDIASSGSAATNDVTKADLAADGADDEYADLRDDDDGEEVEQSAFGRMVTDIQGHVTDFWENHGSKVKYFVAAMFVALYAVYFGFAMAYEFGSESSIRLLWMTLLGVFIVLVTIVKARYGDEIYDTVLQPPVTFVDKHYTVFKVLFIAALLVGLVVFLVLDVVLKQPYNMISFCGYLTFLTLIFICSHDPGKVYWRQVLWGVGIQICFALLVIRTTWGYNTFVWLGDRIQEFMAYTDVGSEFVFGEDFRDHMFAFQVMPVVVFLSSVISVLYYLGIMQIVILKLAWVIQRTMSTTAAESVNAVGNIFIGQTESPLLIRPMINTMTNSELHAVMVGGFATIAGSVMATYILYGVPANHLITASVMAAPCALAMSKLSYPEAKRKKHKEHDVAVMDVPPYANVIEAASAGASAAIPLVANIVVNIIAFMALVEFINTTLTWMGHRVGLWPPEYPELSFWLICSYVLWPFAFLMGVAQEDCRQVAELIGIKTFINEMVAYAELGVLIDNSETFNEYNGTVEYINDDIYLVDTNTTLYGGVLEDRSIVIATYALCGFANVASIGTVMGALSSMAPPRAGAISSMTVRAMITGTVVSFMNACIAGLLYDPERDT